MLVKLDCDQISTQDYWRDATGICGAVLLWGQHALCCGGIDWLTATVPHVCIWVWLLVLRSGMIMNMFEDHETF